jgi:hypothetical protein
MKTAEDTTVWNTVKDALKYAEEQDGQVPTAHIDYIYNIVENHIKATHKGAEKQDQTKKRHKNKRGKGNKNKSPQYMYARTQELFAKNPGLLAKSIRENVSLTEQTTTQLSENEVKDLYKGLWETIPTIEQPFSGDLGEEDSNLDLLSLLPDISRKDIKTRIAQTKTNTAAGPDGLSKNHIKTARIQEILRLLYVFITACGRQPTAWRENRTILLPKEGKDPNDVRNYRPVTISSILSRIYWGIIDRKLRSLVRFSPRQKGFMNEPGCFNNIHIANEMVNMSKRKTGMTMVQLDISKAFDTVPHEVIGDALRRKGIPETVVNLIINSYKDIHTNIKQGSLQIPMAIRRGVKQGDPLSPLIFNAVLEPLLLQLEDMKGYCINNTKVSALAFADDLILVSSERGEAKMLLQKTEKYLEGLGMGISAPKCATFSIKATKDSWHIEDPDLSTEKGEKIPMLSAGATTHYLGGTFSPWKGLTEERLETEFGETLRRVERLALKPHQKAQLITTYIAPHFLHTLILAMVPVTTIRKLDQELRRTIKNIYHLPQCTANGLLYCGKRSGGLGIPKLEVIATSASLKMGIKFKNNPDPVMRAIYEESGLDKRLEKIAKTARIQWPISGLRDIEKYKAQEKKREIKQWAQLKSQGKAVSAFTENKVGNAWLKNPKFLRPSKYITALKMRANVAGDRAALVRAKIKDDINYRKCHAQEETLGHILGQCISTKKERIRRHDDIKDFILKEVVEKDKEAIVTNEPTLRTPEGSVLKPDLVIKNREGVFVVDVTVRHEDGDYLRIARKGKIDKYEKLLPDLKERLKADRGEVLPIVVGTRGVIPNETLLALEKLNIRSKSKLTTISMIALRKSIEIYNGFMDYDWQGGEVPPRQLQTAQS